MTCTTFLHDCELNIKTSNADLNLLLSDVRDATGEDWQVIERKFIITPAWWNFWTKPTDISKFSVYKYVGGIGPWQCINFCTPRSIYESLTGLQGVDSSTVINYFYGILAGAQAIERKYSGKTNT